MQPLYASTYVLRRQRIDSAACQQSTHDIRLAAARGVVQRGGAHLQESCGDGGGADGLACDGRTSHSAALGSTCGKVKRNLMASTLPL